MTLELSEPERTMLEKIVGTYLSDLRHTIAATQRGTADLHHDEDLINRLLARLAPQAAGEPTGTSATTV